MIITMIIVIMIIIIVIIVFISNVNCELIMINRIHRDKSTRDKYLLKGEYQQVEDSVSHLLLLVINSKVGFINGEKRQEKKREVYLYFLK